MNSPSVPPDPALRLLGLTTYPIRHDGIRYTGKGGDLFNNLGSRFELVGLGAIEVAGAAKWLHRLRYFHPIRSQWGTAARMNVRAFAERSRLAEAFIRQHEGQYDLLFQLHSMMSPGLDLTARPYIIAVDNTYAISEREWQAWVPVKRDRQAWMQREGEVYRHALAVFTWSEFARQSIITDYGADPAKVFVSGTSGNFTVEPQPTADFSQPVALFVGAEFERKGGYVLLEAWQQVHAQLPEARLWIVGPRRAPATLPPGVQWWGHVTDRTALGDLFRQARVYVLPSLFEPFAMSLLEAMGFGLPCISTRTGGTREMIEPGVNGLLVERGDPRSLSEALLDLLRDPALARQMGRSGHQRVQANYNWSSVVGRMEPVIRQVYAAYQANRLKN